MPTEGKPRNAAPTKADFFMGGASKTSEFAVFYNIALNGVLRKIHFKQTGLTEFDENKVDALYGRYLDGFESDSLVNDFSDRVYLSLRDFLWKGYETDKNSSGHSLTDEDKAMIRKLLVKLRFIRNYHSHIWHHNDGLKCDKFLMEFVQEKYDAALNKQYKKHPVEVDMYKRDTEGYPLFKEGYITVEGRVFFLSFFLTSGEMSAFLQQRKGSKRSDELKFRIKHLVYRYYTHRDGATRQKFSHEDSVLSSLPL